MANILYILQLRAIPVERQLFLAVPSPASQLGLKVCSIKRAYSVSQKNPPMKFSDIFPKRFGIFSPNFTCLLFVPIYAGLKICIQLPATLTKLCHIKRDHHNVLKMSTID